MNETQARRIPFTNLMAGVVMLVKGKKNFVNESISIENLTNMAFINAKTSRISIGHDEKGNLMIVEIDGWATALNKVGMGLRDLADLLIKFGAVNAINLGKFLDLYRWWWINFCCTRCIIK
jgi:exopolysaccharide biosynthesis protein